MFEKHSEEEDEVNPQFVPLVDEKMHLIFGCP